ncbi:hypothetical protein ACKAV7_007152 [Fusarium commune]
MKSSLPKVVDVREGPYSHLNPASIQDALYYLEDERSPSSSATSPGTSVATSATQPRTDLWLPYKIQSSANGDDDDTIAQSVWTITANSTTKAKLNYSKELVTEILGSQDHDERYNILPPVDGSAVQLEYLPMKPTKLNKELVRIHLQLLSRFKCAVDGNPDPANEFMNFWIPCTLQDPLLLQIVLFTSSCWLSETRYLPKALQYAHKHQVYRMLNSQLTDQQAQMSDTLVLGVVQMIADSWYWGATHDLKAHLSGLRGMINLRGGLSQLGLRGYLAKMVLIHDIVMALAHEIKPSMYGHPGFEFRDTRTMPFKTAFNTPLISNWQSFKECSNSLQLHPSTAQILDDMRSLFSAVLALPRNPRSEHVQRVLSTAHWFHERILDLPEDTPALQSPRPSHSSRASSVESPGNSAGSLRTDKSSSPFVLPDMMYRVIRKVALIYCRAVLNRSPISSACSEEDIQAIWLSIWQSGLATWKSVLGIFAWVMVALVTNCHKIGPGRLIKTLTMSTMMSIGMENWDVFNHIAKTSFRLQRWLAGGRDDTNDLMGGEKVVDKYGFGMFTKLHGTESGLLRGTMYDFIPLRGNIPHGDVLLPGDDGYEEVLQRWSAACVKRAAAVILPINSQEVSTAVKFAVSNQIPMTVCGGGHSSSGASSSEGMVIDLRKMRNVKVDTEAMTVDFEGGCLWKDVDTALERHGLATVGGVVNHTGVGGLTLGGGHGFLTPRHGLTIDNLLKAEVVLADGTIVEASEDTNRDLFWAIRGAGAQFVVVTLFVSRAHRQNKVWSGTLAYSADKLPHLLRFANVLYGRPNPDGHCFALGIGFGPDEMTRTVSAIPLFHGLEGDAKQYFSGLLELEAIANNTEMMTTAKTNTLLNSVMDHGIRRLMGSGNITMPLDIEPMLQTAETFWKFCESHDGMGKSVLAIEFFPTDKIREVPQDATAYANRGDYYDAMTSFAWENPDYDSEIRQFNRGLCKRIRETNGYSATAGGHWSKGPVGVYINIEADSISPKDAWGVNLPRLRELKRKYDPNNVFNKWHGIAEDTSGAG